MNSRNVFATILTACLLTVGLGSLGPATDTAQAGQSHAKYREGARSEYKRQGYIKRIPLPTGPASVYHDYPHYYSRGYYPTHIGGYYYYPYDYRGGEYRR